VAEKNSERLPVQTVQTRPTLQTGTTKLQTKKKLPLQSSCCMRKRRSYALCKRVLTKTVLPSPAQDIPGINLTQISALSASWTETKGKIISVYLSIVKAHTAAHLQKEHTYGSGLGSGAVSHSFRNLLGPQRQDSNSNLNAFQSTESPAGSSSTQHT